MRLDRAAVEATRGIRERVRGPGAAESAASSAERIEQLPERGLVSVCLVIADAHRGLAAAVRRFPPEVRIQRCTVLLERNVLAKIPQRFRPRMARELSAIFNAASTASRSLRWRSTTRQRFVGAASGRSRKPHDRQNT